MDVNSMIFRDLVIDVQYATILIFAKNAKRPYLIPIHSSKSNIPIKLLSKLFAF